MSLAPCFFTRLSIYSYRSAKCVSYILLPVVDMLMFWPGTYSVVRLSDALILTDVSSTSCALPFLLTSPAASAGFHILKDETYVYDLLAGMYGSVTLRDADTRLYIFMYLVLGGVDPISTGCADCAITNVGTNVRNKANTFSFITRWFWHL